MPVGQGTAAGVPGVECRPAAGDFGFNLVVDAEIPGRVAGRRPIEVQHGAQFAVLLQEIEKVVNFKCEQEELK